jgi:D-galacturonate reductase
MMDLKSRGKCGRLAMAGVNGKKFPGIREHMQRAIGDVYKGLDLKIDTYPKDNKVDADAYKAAIKSFKPGSAVTIFTPDDTHFDIAMCAINQGLHVMVTKPAVMTLEHHAALHKAAKRKGVILCIEVHKRWDPCYADARDKIQNLGPFSYFYAYMSQPKH